MKTIGELVNEFIEQLKKERNERNNQFGLDKMLNPQNK